MDKLLFKVITYLFIAQHINSLNIRGVATPHIPLIKMVCLGRQVRLLSNLRHLELLFVEVEVVVRLFTCNRP